MPTLIPALSRIEAAGSKPKQIDEYVGRVNSGHGQVSVAHLRSPGGWVEPGQTPRIDEFTIVLKDMLRVAHRGGTLEVRAGQAVVAHAGEWVRYRAPEADGPEYIAVRVPAFSPGLRSRAEGDSRPEANEVKHPFSDVTARGWKPSPKAPRCVGRMALV